MSAPAGMVHRLVVVGALAAGVFLVGGCGDDGVNPAANAVTPPDITITGTDQLTFEPQAIAIRAGDEIVLQLTSESGVEHDVTIAGAADAGVAGESDDRSTTDREADDLHVVHADAGQTVSVTFRIDEPGSYEVYCSIPGHREAGMTATLTVSEPASDR